MKKASILIMIVSVLSKILGFLREAVLAAFVGVNPVSDAFVFSFNLPHTIFSLIAAAFVTGFIPMYTRIENESEDGPIKANRFLNNILNSMLVLCAILCLLYLLFTDLFLVLLLPNASVDQLLYLVPFTQVTIFSIFFTCIVQLFTGFLHVKDSFVVPALIGFPMNFVVITTLILSKSLGTIILPFGVLISFALQALLILGYARHKGYRFKFVLDLKDKHLLTMLMLALPLIVGTASDVFANMIMQGIVSGVSGGITLLNNSIKTGGLVYGIFGTAIITVVYPSISRSISLKKFDDVRTEFGDALVSLLLFILPSTVGLVLLANPVLEFIYLRGEFTQANLNALIPTFICYAFGLPFMSLRHLIVRVFYGYQDMKTPMINSIIILASQFVLGMVLFNILGLPGVTLAMTISYAVGVTVMLFQLQSKLKTFPIKKYAIQIAKLLVASLIMGVVVYLGYELLSSADLGKTLPLMLSIVVGVIVYLSVILFSRIDTVDEMINSIKAKVKG